MSMWIKSILYSTIVIGTGYMLLEYTNSKEPELIQKMNEQGRVHPKSDDDLKKQQLMDMLKQNMESNNPAWKVEWFINLF